MARIMRQRRTEALFGILMFDLSMPYIMDEGEYFVMDEDEFFSIEATRVGCGRISIRMTRVHPSSLLMSDRVLTGYSVLTPDDDRVVLSMMVRPTNWFGQRKPCSSATLNDVARAHTDRIFIVTSGTLFAQGVMKAREEFVSAAAGGADFDDRILQYIMTKNRTIRQKDIISKVSMFESIAVEQRVVHDIDTDNHMSATT
ncbi:unnamed protein product [Bursaphelenchus xylophilus]|uniref:(pine wood nematode) hypothetical protein n=1 Tax=Bursaphelenchus xylophilus TaxID=6326 RepID=A0A1I7RX58_BURXY|nr:unnamed protein product [Bursaphelenchus xylophilus]CAG9121341.1 unnamed protein product [Bursaphelenchus xylophilus]